MFIKDRKSMQIWRIPLSQPTKEDPIQVYTRLIKFMDTPGEVLLYTEDTEKFPEIIFDITRGSFGSGYVVYNYLAHTYRVIAKSTDESLHTNDGKIFYYFRAWEPQFGQSSVVNYVYDDTGNVIYPGDILATGVTKIDRSTSQIQTTLSLGRIFDLEYHFGETSDTLTFADTGMAISSQQVREDGSKQCKYVTYNFFTEEITEKDPSSCSDGTLTNDGRYYVFDSLDEDYLKKDPGFFPTSDLFRMDMKDASITHINARYAGSRDTRDLGVWQMSNNGKIIVFTSSQINLVPGSDKTLNNIFIYQDK